MDLIRDSLFSIQVKQPWSCCNMATRMWKAFGLTRVERRLSPSPDENNGQDREEIVVEEIEDRENTNLTITKTINRLGTVFFLFMFNIGISIFVFLLTGIMIFSQVLFIIYAMFLPVSFLLSMVPSFEGMSKRAITKLFNTILTRAGITLIITVVFSISTTSTTCLGNIRSSDSVLQIVNLCRNLFQAGGFNGDVLLNRVGDSQSMGSRIMRRPRMLMHAHMHRLQHKLGRFCCSSWGWNGCIPRRGSRLAQTRELFQHPVLPNGHRQTTADQTGRQHRKRNRMETGWLCGRCGGRYQR